MNNTCRTISKLSLSAAILLAVSACSKTEPTQATATFFKAPPILPFTVNVSSPMTTLSHDITKADVKQLANLVADWQIRHQGDYHASPLANFQGLQRYSFGGWLMGTMAVGMAEWGQLAGNEKYLDFIRQEAEIFQWGVQSRVFDADDYLIGQTYLELYDIDKNAKYLGPLTKRLDHIYKNWPTVHDKKSGQNCVEMLSDCRERWTWIDALFMGAPVWAHMAKSTGDKKYLEFADYEFWASFDTFWDEQESLLYRDARFIGAHDKDGKKIFWSRGNGWVFASLTRMLDVLPKDHVNRDKYINRFQAMAKRLAELQQGDGSWHPSLLNPKAFDMPENSGSSFYTFGFAWGVNNGLLDADKYLPVIKSAWSNLHRNIYADGRVGHIQPSGYDPRTAHKEDTDVYGVGSFLLAASQVYQLAQ